MLAYLFLFLTTKDLFVTTFSTVFNQTETTIERDGNAYKDILIRTNTSTISLLNIPTQSPLHSPPLQLPPPPPPPSPRSRLPSGASDEENLLWYLFVNYNPSARPVLDSSATVSVNLKFSLLQIQELNVRNQILTSTGFLILEWRDERLTWSRDISSLDEVVVKGENIWRPEFAVINGAESIYGEYNEFQAIIRADGFIRWEPGGIFKTMCSIDITFYPFDAQRCEIKFGAWSYHTTKMNLTTDEHSIRIDAYEKNGEWQVMQTDAKRNEFAFECCPSQRFSYICFAVELRRRHTFYVMNVIVPGLLTSAVLLSLFYCVPSQKVHIGVAALLSFRLFLVNVADTVPRTSDHIPLLGIYLTCTMAITTLAMVATVLVGNLYERKDRPVPKWLKTLMMEHLARILCMNRGLACHDGDCTKNRTEKQRSRSLSCSWCCLNDSKEKRDYDEEHSFEYLREDEELEMMATYDPRSRRTHVKTHRAPTTKGEKERLKDFPGHKPNKMSRSKSFDISSALASIAIRHLNDADKFRTEIAEKRSTEVLMPNPVLVKEDPDASNAAQESTLSTSDVQMSQEGKGREYIIDNCGRGSDGKINVDSNKNIGQKRLSSVEEELGELRETSDTCNNHWNTHKQWEKDNTEDVPRPDTHFGRTELEARIRHRSSKKTKAEEKDDLWSQASPAKSSLESRKPTEEKPVDYSKDWAHLAAICDRFFFWLCLFFILGTTLLLFHPLTTSRFFKIPVIDKT